jgi:hypothetical protein
MVHAVIHVGRGVQKTGQVWDKEIIDLTIRVRTVKLRTSSL